MKHQGRKRRRAEAKAAVTLTVEMGASTGSAGETKWRRTSRLGLGRQRVGCDRHARLLHHHWYTHRSPPAAARRWRDHRSDRDPGYVCDDAAGMARERPDHFPGEQHPFFQPAVGESDGAAICGNVPCAGDNQHGRDGVGSRQSAGARGVLQRFDPRGNRYDGAVFPKLEQRSRRFVSDASRGIRR